MDLPRGSPIRVLLMTPCMDRKVVAFKHDACNDKDAISSLIRSIIATSSLAQRRAFHVFDLAKVIDLFGGWRGALPDVRTYYAIKCNPEPALLSALAELGAGFDYVSRAEMEAVLALGVKPCSIIYANSCKPEVHLRYAAEAGINLTTYDSEEEVSKVEHCHPRCELLIRIKGPNGGAVAKVNLGTKYGAHAYEVVPLLRAAWRPGLTVAGVYFRVGTGALQFDVYRVAIEATRAAFNAAAVLGMPPMHVLDIGGGFTAGTMFYEAAIVIKDALARHFGDMPGVDAIGEPGRYFAETAFTLAACVIGKRRRGEVREYWIDDGIYGSLNCINMDHYVPRPKPLCRNPLKGKETYTSTVFGPTCDSLDTVVAGYQLSEMSLGDWLIFDNMGAYTTAAGSNFNGFSMSNINTYVLYSS